MRNECPIYLSNVKRYSDAEEKGKKSPGWKKKGNEDKQCAEIRFTWLSTDNAKNAECFENTEDEGDGENKVNVAKRAVLLPGGAILDWGYGPPPPPTK